MLQVIKKKPTQWIIVENAPELINRMYKWSKSDQLPEKYEDQVTSLKSGVEEEKAAFLSVVRTLEQGNILESSDGSIYTHHVSLFVH